MFTMYLLWGIQQSTRIQSLALGFASQNLICLVHLDRACAPPDIFLFFKAELLWRDP